MQTRLSRPNTSSAFAPFLVPAVTLLTLLLCGAGAGADEASTPAPAPLVAAAAELGSPPSGEIPILFNDHTVYAKPDVLTRSRVLAALVKGGVIFVPLRSMFEQMGATVSVSADGKTITALKSGASVSVTLDKAEVVINGESRPLDVPPMLYKGIVLVPVRVISEGLGTYDAYCGSDSDSDSPRRADHGANTHPNLRATAALESRFHCGRILEGSELQRVLRGPVLSAIILAQRSIYVQGFAVRRQTRLPPRRIRDQR